MRMPNPHIADLAKQTAARRAETLRGRSQTTEHIARRAASTKATLAASTRICRECGGSFTPTSGPQAYCSGQCWNRVANRKRAKVHRLHITPNRYTELVKLFGNQCGICGVESLGRRLAVDHIHETHFIRGLLCSRCNSGLTLLQDDPDVLRAAIAYLEREPSPA